jgi:hypothetical protein
VGAPHAQNTFLHSNLPLLFTYTSLPRQTARSLLARCFSFAGAATVRSACGGKYHAAKIRKNVRKIMRRYELERRRAFVNNKTVRVRRHCTVLRIRGAGGCCVAYASDNAPPGSM